MVVNSSDYYARVTHTSPHNFSQHIFYILISQAVDQEIQHGDHHGIENRSHPLLVHITATGGWFKIHMADP